MVRIENRQFLIDGKPQMILSGELHYFRVAREEWQDRIDKMKAAGCNTVASYIPWLCHEYIEGQPDFDGSTRPELALGDFIDLCRDNGLYFIARPGPFIMAEIKNEGLPYWIYEKHPEIIPESWDGLPIKSANVDYLAPAFLEETKSWYQKVMPILVSRLQDKGGNIIAVQLDNEIGMLSWITNKPDLTYTVLSDFFNWIKKNHDADTLKTRYPFGFNSLRNFVPQIRTPQPDYAAALREDLGHYMRNRFARYVSALRNYAEEFGVKDVPFIINVHGTSNNRALTFPIGISQLYESYTQKPGYLAGTDIYLSHFNHENFQDLYIINAFMNSVNLDDHLLTSMEFETGDGNYGQTFGNRQETASIDMKFRMCVAQGARMINQYLMAGGHNYMLDPPPDDGDGRIAITGERHGFAAPIGPEGQLNYTFDQIARCHKTMSAVSEKIGTMTEEHDNLTLAFIPDYFMTEYKYPSSDVMNAINSNLEVNRGQLAWEHMVRAALLSNYRFGATNIQDNPLDKTVPGVMMLASARYMNSDVQTKLVDWIEKGGSLLLYGELPIYDMSGNACTILADALGADVLGIRKHTDHQFLTVASAGWASPRADIRTHFAQTFKNTTATPIFTLKGTKEVCGFEQSLGKGKAIVITAQLVCDIPLFTQALTRLGATPALKNDSPFLGVFTTTTANDQGERFLHMMNLDYFQKPMRIFENDVPLLGKKPFILKERASVMLPLNVVFNDVAVKTSTAEITGVERNSIQFRLTQPQDSIVLKTDRECLRSKDYKATRIGDELHIVSHKDSRIDDNLTVRFKSNRKKLSLAL